jgi:uncharacterized flavoprotein (TIGR03862 family)
MNNDPTSCDALVVGGGPAGLMAAERLALAGLRPIVAEAMPSLGRKFLMAGKSGLNLTKEQDRDPFCAAYGAAEGRIAPLVDRFSPHDLRAWAAELGSQTFAGPSGRVFPREMKASPLLRAWARRLAEQGAELRARWRWTGWADGVFTFDTPDGPRALKPRVAVLALGGGSWPRLGSDGGWTGLLAAQGVDIAPLRPANMGFNADWSDFMRDKFAGAPVKNVTLSVQRGRDIVAKAEGEFVVSGYGVEGGAVYSVSAALRDEMEAGGVRLFVDLAPGRDALSIQLALERTPPKASRSNRLRKIKIDGVKAALLRECAPRAATDQALAGAIKRLPLPITGPRPIAEAISSAGGVAWGALDDGLMLRALPGVFCAGEMIDWEAPTGGYLLTACYATGLAAGDAAAAFAAR